MDLLTDRTVHNRLLQGCSTNNSKDHPLHSSCTSSINSHFIIIFNSSSRCTNNSILRSLHHHILVNNSNSSSSILQWARILD